jgi:hypothetical protein
MSFATARLAMQPKWRAQTKSAFLRLLATGCVYLPIAANAQIETLTYQSGILTGAEQQTTGGPPPPPPPRNITASFDVTLELASPLADDLNDAIVTPLSWTADCVSSGFNLCYEAGSYIPLPGYASFQFSTNANGTITGWSFIEKGTIGPDGTITLTSSGPLSQDAYSLVTKCCTAYNDTATGPSSKWTVNVTGAPEPGSFVLMVTALGFFTLVVGAHPRFRCIGKVTAHPT